MGELVFYSEKSAGLLGKVEEVKKGELLSWTFSTKFKGKSSNRVGIPLWKGIIILS